MQVFPVMTAAGIDLGGSKIEAQVFGADWQLLHRMRWPTPKDDYAAQVAAIASAVTWCATHGDQNLPIGVSAAGLMNPRTGLALTANLAATGRPFVRDIAAASGRGIHWINDARALALSEATFGAGIGFETVLALSFGTGLAGGIITGGRIMPSFAGIGGEFGHFPLSAVPMRAHNLPILACGCGRVGCSETLLSGPGLSQIARHVTGRTLTAKEIVAGRDTDPDLWRVWQIWLELACDFLIILCFTIDPAVIVLGGGLSNAPGIVDDLQTSLQKATLSGFAVPPVRLAFGGDASGARGAAYFAHCAVHGAGIADE
jgi:N-acetylglucosamine kinase